MAKHYHWNCNNFFSFIFFFGEFFFSFIDNKKKNDYMNKSSKLESGSMKHAHEQKLVPTYGWLRKSNSPSMMWAQIEEQV